ncbi:MAG: YraN family protein [Planctomycetota bacterium]|nr:YraN family protein [Planctomycetota bacterium]
MFAKARKQLSRWIYSNGFFLAIAERIGGETIAPEAPLGRRGEQAAALFLKKLGYRILAHSHRQRLGEIDLIALDVDCLVFVEVKTWQSDVIADPSEAVDARKQEKLTRAALIYLKQKKLLARPARFDVISVVWPERRSEPEKIMHYIDAFEAVGSGQMYR